MSEAGDTTGLLCGRGGSQPSGSVSPSVRLAQDLDGPSAHLPGQDYDGQASPDKVVSSHQVQELRGPGDLEGLFWGPRVHRSAESALGRERIPLGRTRVGRGGA